MREAAQTPQEFAPRPPAALTSQVTEDPAAEAQVPAVGSGGRNSGFGQPRGRSGCHSQALNELPMGGKCPIFSKLCLILVAQS